MPQPTPAAGPARRATGMTLAEVVLALALTAILGLAVTSMMFVAGQGGEDQARTRTLTVAMEASAARLDTAIRASCQVLALGDGYVVLWLGDSKVNSHPDRSELMRIQWDSISGELSGYRSPPDMDPGLDVEYDPDTTDFAAVTAGILGQSFFPGQLWATGVTGWSPSVPDGDCRDATYLCYDLTLASNGQSLRGVGGGPMRRQ